VSSAEETNKDLVPRFFEALAQRDLEALEEMMVPDFVNHTKLPPGQEASDREDYLGREGYKRRVADKQAAFSDFRFIIGDQAAEGDKVITRSTVRATHDRGKVLGFAPTGREIETSYITIHRIVEGKMAEEWTEGGGLLELTKQRLEQEDRARARRAGAQGGKAHPAGLVTKRRARTRGLGDLPTLPPS
jgi:predicted ester cyclase